MKYLPCQKIGLLLLLLLPVTGFANGFSPFSPPATDLSLQVMQAIFGTGSDPLSGKLIRPLLLVLSSSVVIFMGAIFSWNLVKFVLHTSQQGEMMMGKGKELGLVMLRSVFGISMVLPIYTGPYQGLCMAYVVVSWLITQGIGLADLGNNRAIDYLTAGGTIYQMPASFQDTAAQKAMATSALTILAAQVCLDNLRAIQAAQRKSDTNVNQSLQAVGSNTTEATTTPSSNDIGSGLTSDGKRITFGTRDTRSAPNTPTRYFEQCGSVTLPILSAGATKQEQNRAQFLFQEAASTMISGLAPLASNIAANYPTNTESLNVLTPAEVANSIFQYSNMMGPLRAQGADQSTKKAYDELQKMRTLGWIVLGAYYPMMGNLNLKDNRTALSGYTLGSSRAQLQFTNTNSDSAFDIKSLTPPQIQNIQLQMNYVTGSNTSVENYIDAINSGNVSTLQNTINQTSPNNNPTTNNGPEWISKANAFFGGASAFTMQEIDAKNGLRDVARPLAVVVDQASNFFTTKGNVFGKSATGGETFGGVLDQEKVRQSATFVGLATAPGGPLVWATMIPALIVFSNIVSNFRNAIDQTQNADPLLALQKFGFYVMDQCVLLIAISLGGSFLATFPASIVPSANPAAGIQAGANLEQPLMLMIFAAYAAAGIGFGIHIPTIPFIVFLSGILGWIGHCFQAVVGAPLVALRMTTAEGEGMLGGATEGVMMLLGVLFTPILLVIGMFGSLILIKQMLILVNFLFSTFCKYSFVDPRYTGSYGWIVIGIPGILLIYYTIVVTMIQGICTKLIGELPGEALRHVHTAMTGHKSAEQMGQKMEQGTDRMSDKTGDYSGKKSMQGYGKAGGGDGGGGKDKDKDKTPPAA